MRARSRRAGEEVDRGSSDGRVEQLGRIVVVVDAILLVEESVVVHRTRMYVRDGGTSISTDWVGRHVWLRPRSSIRSGSNKESGPSGDPPPPAGAVALVRNGTTASPPELSAAVACVVVGLFAMGLYRWDWAHFGVNVAARIVAGAGAGLAAMAVLQRALPIQDPFSVMMLTLAWLTVGISVCGTRIAVRVIDRWLHRLGGVRG